jgi:peptide/nickel transport system permease protein
VPTLVFVSMLIFGLQQLLPGDPAEILAGEERDPNVVAYLHQKLHLDEPLPVRYGYWVGGVLRGDLGESVRTQQPVLDLIVQKLPVTIELALLAMRRARRSAFPPASSRRSAAARRGTTAPTRSRSGAVDAELLARHPDDPAVLGAARLAAGVGLRQPVRDLRANLAAMVMPAFVLGNAIAAVLMRHTRSAMLQVLHADYVRTARAKGLRERASCCKHALRNALTPIITLGALEFGTLLSGAVLTEQVFTIPASAS